MAPHARGPSFSPEETAALIDLVEKHKMVILDTSTNSTINREKEDAWNSIERAYRSKGFKHPRNAENLKTKWDNLKKVARRMSKNLLEGAMCNELTERIVLMLSEHNPNGCSNGIISIASGENSNNSEVTLNNEKDFEWDSQMVKAENPKGKDSNADWEMNCDDEDSTTISKVEIQMDNDTDNDKDDGSSRSANFSPAETKLLLQCVREKGKVVFFKSNTNKIINLKNRAWNQITEAFNARSGAAARRSARALRTRFTNMKRLARASRLGGVLGQLRRAAPPPDDDHGGQRIKPEPLEEWSDSPDTTAPADPLRAAWEAGGGGAEAGAADARARELLELQIETAKLEHQRALNALRAEAATHAARAAEAALRLRAARLDAAAAEARLPPHHPARAPLPREAQAEEYAKQCE